MVRARRRPADRSVLGRGLLSTTAVPGAPPGDRPAVPIALLSFTAGTTVANLYYNQPLLPAIGRTFGVPDSHVGIVATATQIGYAAGLLFFVPLGDVLERRRLMVALLVAVAVSLGVAAAAPSLPWLVLASVAVGATTVVPQLVIPYAAGMTPPARRGRVVGRIMGGLLIGILAGRVVAGALGSVVGWRTTFALAAVAMLAIAVLLHRRLAAEAPTSTLSYGALLRSLGFIARQEPVLQEAALLGGLCFLAFSAFWTTLAFRLEMPPLHYGSTVAGAFGLVGIVGASVAPLVGRMADRTTPRTIVGFSLAVVAASYVIFLLAGHTLLGLAAGVIVLDAGTQGVGVSNQARIYSLPAEVHNRVNTVYMVTFFAGGSIGSALGAWAWGAGGWAAVCAVSLAGVALAGLVFALRIGRRRS